MKKTDVIIIGLTILGIILVVYFAYSVNLFFEFSALLGIFPFIGGIVKLMQQKSELREERKKTLVTKLNPVFKKLSKLLEKQKQSIEIKEGFMKKAESFLKKDNVTEVIVLTCIEFSKIAKTPQKYHHSYALALAYTLSNELAIEDGSSAEQIDNSIRKRHTISYGDKNELDEDDVLWYTRFWESENLLNNAFNEIYEEVKDLQEEQIYKTQTLVKLNYKDFEKIFEQKNPKIDKLIELVTKNIPTINFNKILSTLRTEVVIVSTMGGKGGSKFLIPVLDKKILPTGPKLNRAVRFVLLDEITKNERDPLFFDLKHWGEEIDNDAKDQRRSSGEIDSTFSFVIMKSSIHEMYFFGDALPEKGMIRLPPEILDGLKPDETTKSTLQVLAKALGKEELSLLDFIERNLEYLDGIPDYDTAKRITQSLEERFDVAKWTILDFLRPDLEPKHIVEAGVSLNQAESIISESGDLAKLLHKS